MQCFQIILVLRPFGESLRPMEDRMADPFVLTNSVGQIKSSQAACHLATWCASLITCISYIIFHISLDGITWNLRERLIINNDHFKAQLRTLVVDPTLLQAQLIGLHHLSPFYLFPSICLTINCLNICFIFLHVYDIFCSQVTEPSELQGGDVQTESGRAQICWQPGPHVGWPFKSSSIKDVIVFLTMMTTKIQVSRASRQQRARGTSSSNASSPRWGSSLW